jgi:hypothetical protein
MRTRQIRSSAAPETTSVVRTYIASKPGQEMREMQLAQDSNSSGKVIE